LLSANEAEYAKLTSWDQQYKFAYDHLEENSAKLFASLPIDIQKQLLMDRDPHGNVQVSRIETEKLLITLVSAELKKRAAAGSYKGKFSALNHFFGYEGRCAFPSNFDADYCYSLGYNAYLLIANGVTGYMSVVSNLAAGPANWNAGGIPITKMMNLEKRHGEFKPVIRKALVELDGPVFKYFEKHRAEWAKETAFRYPGAIQYYGDAEVCDITTITLALEHNLWKD
nr:diphosphate--fructose-6-phosphate 1-phosphotransferase [Sphaerochaetaceae bacterium]